MSYVLTGGLSIDNIKKDIAGAKNRTADTGKNVNEKSAVVGTPNIALQGDNMSSIAARFVLASKALFDDPAIDMCFFQINWDDTAGLFAPETSKNSALYYLKESGEIGRYKALLTVHEQMKLMFDAKSSASVARSYALLSIDGLTNLDEGERHVGEPKDITLVCQDSVRWQMRTIAHSLRYIYYDTSRQIEILPRNLRKFSCWFAVTDVRDFTDWYDYDRPQAPVGDINAAPTYDNPFIKNLGDNTLPKPYLAVFASYAELNMNRMPGSVSNAEPGDGNIAEMLVSVFSAHYELFNPAIEYIAFNQKELIKLQSMEPAEAAEEAKSWWNKMTDKAKAYAIQSAKIYADAGLRVVQNAAGQLVGKSVTAFQESSVGKVANQVLKVVTTPQLVAGWAENELNSIVDNALDKLFGKQKSIEVQTYVNDDFGKVDSGSTEHVQQYVANLPKSTQVEQSNSNDSQYVSTKELNSGETVIGDTYANRQ